MNDELTESLEKYLIAVYNIVKTNKAARVKDIATYLNIGAASTSDAIKNLTQKGFINYEPYGVITITNKGIKKAEKKISRHQIISNFLEKVLVVPPEKIETSVKQFEYSMPEDIIGKFVQFLSFMEKCSCKEPKWIKSYQYFVQNGLMKNKCKECMTSKKINCCSK